MEEPSPVAVAPAGWYPDDASGRERYWNGSAWTDDTRERVVPLEAPASSTPIIAGFWRRSLAFLLDGLLLGLAGSALGFALFDVMAGLGVWGRLVGFAISLFYFGLLDSSIGGGQTLGKRLMKIRVVDRAGTTLPLWKTMARFTVLAAPTYLNNLALPVTAMSPVILFLVGFILFGMGSASIYLYVFNKATRQSVHDLSVGSFVVRADADRPVEARMWRGHLAIAGSLVGVALLGIGASTILAGKLPAGLLDAVEALNETDRVHTASVFVGKVWGEKGDSEYVTVNAIVKQNPDDPDSLMRELAQTVVRAYPKAKEVHHINVTLTYGFDLGIASGWRRTGATYAPAEWAVESESKESGITSASVSD